LAANGVFISTCVFNIARFVTVLKQITMTIKKNEALDSDRYALVMVDKTLDQFFISDDGYYIESTYIYEFVEEALKLCELMEGAESAEYGVQEHNLRILTKTFASLKSILTGLLQVLAT
jgi:hypothetical protein